MAKVVYDDWRAKNTFTEWERACLLADVEPYQEMSGDEMQNVRQNMERIEALEKLKSGAAEDILFSKLLTF